MSYFLQMVKDFESSAKERTCSVYPSDSICLWKKSYNYVHVRWTGPIWSWMQLSHLRSTSGCRQHRKQMQVLLTLWCQGESHHVPGHFNLKDDCWSWDIVMFKSGGTRLVWLDNFHWNNTWKSHFLITTSKWLTTVGGTTVRAGEIAVLDWLCLQINHNLIRLNPSRRNCLTAVTKWLLSWSGGAKVA